MSKLMRIGLAILFFLAAICALLYMGESKVYAQEPEEIVLADGMCGTDATWEYSEETNTLTISGNGAMTSYTYGLHRGIPMSAKSRKL